MANSPKNVTISLQSSLNMNRNESLTDSSFSIFNKQNSPVFGGSISPLHYKLNGETDAKYSSDGTKWTMVNNNLYKNDELFRSFSGNYAFDVVDTGKDYLGFIEMNSANTFAGVKVIGKTIQIQELNSNLDVTATTNIYTLGGTEKLTGLRLCKRGDFVLLILVYQNSAESTTPMTIRAYKFSNGSWSQIGSPFNFCFRKPKENDETTKIEYESSTEATSVSQNFIAVSSLMPGENLFLTIFKTRPNGVNTFKNIQFSSIELLLGAHPINEYREITLMSGGNRVAFVKVDDGDINTEKDNRETLGFVVDNTSIVMAIGHVQNTKDYSWCKMMSTATNIVEDGSAHGYLTFYPALQGNDTSTATTDAIFDAIFVEGGHDKFAEIQTLGSSCLTTNYNGYGRLVLAGFGDSWDDDKQTCPVVDVVYDAQFNDSFQWTRKNGSTQQVRNSFGLWNCGVQSNTSIPTTKDGWNEWWSNRETSDNTCWNSTGARNQIGSTKFYTLFNGREGTAVGISFATSKDTVGTLLTEWGGIVATFENCATSDRVFFKDAKTSTVKYIKTRSTLTLDDVDIIGNYVLIRCSANENVYDISQDRWAKFANDWNNRVFTGYKNMFPYFNINAGAYINKSYIYLKSKAVDIYSSSYASTASIAAGYDVAYVKEKGFSPSRLYAYNSLTGVVYAEVLASGAELTSTNPLDFFVSPGTSAPSYKCSYIAKGSSTCVSNLAGTTYPVTSSGSAYFNIPIIGSEIVESYSGKYGLKIDDSAYTIAYDGVRPVALYNATSMVDEVHDFFIVQSQYFALINGYICSLSYNSSNVISGVEQIVNVEGMKFIGAFPSCAYFYSPSARAIFAFTGDADLQLFVQTDRITEIYKSQYYPNCEWIFMDTNDGLYVMTQNNTFRVEDLGRVKNFFPTSDDYCVLVMEGGRNIFLSMTKKTGWTTIPVEVETSFFCDGDMKKSTITDWYIRVFKGDEDYNGKVVCSAKTINDIVSQTIKTFDGKVDVKLTKDKFDENSNAMITLHTGCNALGTSCKIVSDYPISYFGFTIGTDGATAKAKYNI